MQESVLLLEVGAQAIRDLSADEKDIILSKYSDAQVKYAGMMTFNVLRKKFRANYRMGRMYEDLSQKYEAYNRIYKEYAQAISAGRNSVTTEGADYSVKKDTFVQHSSDPNAD